MALGNTIAKIATTKPKDSQRLGPCVQFPFRMFIMQTQHADTVLGRE